MPGRLAWRGVVEEYRDLLPVGDATPVSSLGEGATPLRFAPRISEMVGAQVYLKVEGANPTGSFKDRGMAMAMSKALEDGAKAVACASTGNTSASAAAYAAAAGLDCFVVIPEGHIALGKLAQALIHGAKVIQVRGNFDSALSIVRQLAAEEGVTLVNSVNRYRVEGQKTAAFEVADVLGDAPDYCFLPVGNAGNITAYWAGFLQYLASGRSSRLPRMMGFQAAGAAPIVLGHAVEHPETVATAIRIGRPASWKGALDAAAGSGGAVAAVTDAAILEAYGLLARAEGLFCEPASAASVAGLLKADVARGSTVVCVLTGNGLKDPGVAVGRVPLEEPVEADVTAVRQKMGL
ncbi:MAG: threonine synthase [Acidimicrobiales bacterium]